MRGAHDKFIRISTNPYKKDVTKFFVIVFFDDYVNHHHQNQFVELIMSTKNIPSTGCTNCNRFQSIIDEQKSKLNLLETRLKDLIRAYKLITKERDQLQQKISSSLSTLTIIDNHVDHDQQRQQQQKRISELEQNVCHLSRLCGELETDRKHDQLRIKDLQAKYEQLSNESEKNRAIKSTINQPQKQSIELRDNYCQTEIISEKFEQSTQTESRFDVDDQNESSLDVKQLDNTMPQSNTIINKNKNETAIVQPLMRIESKSKSESSDGCSSSIVSASRRSSTAIDHEFDSTKIITSDHQFGSSGATSTSNISLYHLNELARKELELADYRLRCREYECSIRELQWNYSNDRYKFQARIADLEKLNKNLMANNDNNQRLKNHEDSIGGGSGPNSNNINVAYVKNVLSKLLKTSDKNQQKLMTDALIVALDSMQTMNK